MKSKRSQKTGKVFSNSSTAWPAKETLWLAWGLFIFSSFFAVLFNAFYVDGIELKFIAPKQTHVMDHPSTAVSYPGFGSHSKKTPGPSPTPTPLPGDTDVFRRLSLMGAKERYDKKSALFLDARKPEEYIEGHIPGALNFYGNEPEKFAPIVMPQLPDKNREMVVYCHGGDCDLSLMVAKALQEAGYTRVEIFQAGWPAWVHAGYPVNSGEAP